MPGKDAKVTFCYFFIPGEKLDLVTEPPEYDTCVTYKHQPR